MFIVIIEDRHVDVKVIPFSERSLGPAIREARRIAKDRCNHVDDYREESLEGSVFCARFSCEGDCVRIVEERVR